MEILTNIAATVGCILSVISLATLCSKGGRAFIKSLFKRNTLDICEENSRQAEDIKEIKETLTLLMEKMKGLEEVSTQQCRDTIKNIYHTYQGIKRIPMYERTTADKTYSIYHNFFNGNSYASLMYKEICKWEIDNTTQDIFEEE